MVRGVRLRHLDDLVAMDLDVIDGLERHLVMMDQFIIEGYAHTIALAPELAFDNSADHSGRPLLLVAWRALLFKELSRHSTDVIAGASSLPLVHRC